MSMTLADLGGYFSPPVAAPAQAASQVAMSQVTTKNSNNASAMGAGDMSDLAPTFWWLTLFGLWVGLHLLYRFFGEPGTDI